MDSEPPKPPPLPLALPDKPPVLPGLTAQEWMDLRRAKRLLENPGFTARLANAIGRPIEKGLSMLPQGASATVHKATQKALFAALELAVTSLNRGRPRRAASERWHKLLVGASGGVGGAFGLAALPVELPVSTTLMLRSIAEIARSEGHDIHEWEIKLSCLEVFALGGKSESDDAVESSYWAVRAALAKAISEAVTYFSQRGLFDHSAPALLRLVTAIAAKFGIIVSEQMAAKAVPIIGAASGSLVNVMFMDHFQDMARGHFIVKRLEDRYGTEFIQGMYQQLPA